MPLQKLLEDLKAQLAHLDGAGIAKGEEHVVLGVKPAQGGRGPRFVLQGFGEREFIRMNSNSYLGLSLRRELIEAEEHASGGYGVGPGAVRLWDAESVKLKHELRGHEVMTPTQFTSMLYTCAFSADARLLATVALATSWCGTWRQRNRWRASKRRSFTPGTASSASARLAACVRSHFLLTRNCWLPAASINSATLMA